MVAVAVAVQVRLNGLRSAEKHQTLPHTAGLVPKLTLADLEASSFSFPPCMAQLHHDLRATHKLKHEGRLVYTLFLKGAGMPLKEQLESEMARALFWQQRRLALLVCTSLSAAPPQKKNPAAGPTTRPTAQPFPALVVCGLYEADVTADLARCCNLPPDRSAAGSGSASS